MEVDEKPIVRRTRELDVNFVDDDELQAALARQRRAKIHKATKLSPEEIARKSGWMLISARDWLFSDPLCQSSQIALGSNQPLPMTSSRMRERPLNPPSHSTTHPNSFAPSHITPPQSRWCKSNPPQHRLRSEPDRHPETCQCQAMRPWTKSKPARWW